MLEPFVHDFIVNATSGFWSLIEMETNNADPLTFTWDRSALTLDNAKLVKKSRKTIKLQTIDDLSIWSAFIMHTICLGTRTSPFSILL